MVVQGMFISMQSLWAGPWFTRVQGMTGDETAGVLFVFNLVLLVAYVSLGAALPRLTRRGWTTLRLATVATVLILSLQVAIAIVEASWGWLLWLPFAVVSSGLIVVQPHVCTTFPSALTGRAYTAFNLLIFIGVFLCQWLFGVTVDLFRAAGDAPAAAFRHALRLWVAIQALPFGLLVAWRVQPRAPRSEPMVAQPTVSSK
jgi:hypothetical protein